jgi:hypothetical protein
VPEPWDSEALSERRVTVVILRLVFDQQGELSHGEIVDRSGRRFHARFTAWEALVPAVRAWLERDQD